MQLHERLKSFNSVLFAIIGVALAGFLLYVLIQFLQMESRERGFVSSSGGSEEIADSGLNGEEIKAEGRTLLLFSRQVYGKGDGQRDVTFVDTRDGTATALAGFEGRHFHRGQTLSMGEDGPAYGWFARVEVSSEGSGKQFDAVLVRFSDMKVLMIAKAQNALDGPYELDGRKFSLIMNDGRGKARFMVYDVDSGAVAVMRELPLKLRSADGEDRAPQSKFD